MTEETSNTLASCLEGVPMLKLQDGATAPVLNYQLPQKTAITSYGNNSMGLADSYFTEEARQVPDSLSKIETQSEEEIIIELEQDPGLISGDIQRVEDDREALQEVENSPLGGLDNGGLQTDTTTTPSTDTSSLYASYGWDTAQIARKMKAGYAPRIVEGLGRFRPRLLFYERPVAVVATETEPAKYDTEPQLYFVEEYTTVSFLGNYGAGKTLKMHSLFPGESSKITIKTFQELKSVRSRAKNIVDSFSKESAREMEDLLENEASNSTSYSKDKNISASASVSFGLGKFGRGSASTNASTTTKSSRENNTRNLSKALSKHVDKSNSSREVDVNTTSEETQTQSEEVATVREFNNPNQSRVLNFVFRELVQEYISVTYLSDLKIGFGNGHPEMEEVYALEDVDILLDKYIVADKQEEVRQRILHNYAQVESGMVDGKMLDFVQTKTYPEFATNNPIPYLSKNKALQDSYEITPGNTVNIDGVILNVDRNTLRTPAVIVDALLAHGEALDCFNMQLQNEGVKETQEKNRALANENAKQTLILETLNAISDPVQRAEAMAKVFYPPASNDSNHTSV